MPPALNSDAALPRLYLPEEVAAFLGCSAWWVKDRARRRLIPFTRVGRAYRFTTEHLAEIIRMHEARPAAPQQRVPAAPILKPLTPPASSLPAAVPTSRLRARLPRRARQSRFGTAA
ncbi:helix-turn-helix domain-containing protein [Streptomyces katsurahamanus]|uniref:Helix-turn-helix domain-containing protein n=1 Tax=Streptomyces katsurahamanus TaxID=2577098 RepID=A0ABW9NLL2_9ACTN|nr:helix-turn-helix domain-containing protein [Streptomyces katsurahamanus]MQS34173.1 helix-turn-helix domain-containing protein [Streptomyces katsurahamanus]